jgi:hypothetical protein
VGTTGLEVGIKGLAFKPPEPSSYLYTQDKKERDTRLPLVGALIVKAQRPVKSLCALKQFPANSLVVGNGTVVKQAGKILCVYCVAQDKRLRHVEDFLHGAQIRGVCKSDRTGKR